MNRFKFLNKRILKMRLVVLLMLLTVVIVFGLSFDANAGVFRERDRFNVKAQGHGFWMKGRCVLPGKRLGLDDEGAIFKDAGCIVKNRKGKRNPIKEKANIRINIDYYGFIAGEIRFITDDEEECLNKDSCRAKDLRAALERKEEVGDITGLLACIEGWKRDRISNPPQQVIASVGDVPMFADEAEERRTLIRLCPSGTLFDG